MAAQSFAIAARIDLDVTDGGPRGRLALQATVERQLPFDQDNLDALASDGVFFIALTFLPPEGWPKDKSFYIWPSTPSQLLPGDGNPLLADSAQASELPVSPRLVGWPERDPGASYLSWDGWTCFIQDPGPARYVLAGSVQYGADEREMAPARMQVTIEVSLA